MSENKMIENIKKRLNAKTIHDLRQVARAVGVPRPADGKKERILDYILKIASGEADPTPRSARGAPPKSSEYDRQLVADISECRAACISAKGGVVTDTSDAELLVSGKEYIPESEGQIGGILEKYDSDWFLRVNGCKISFTEDVFVHKSFVARFGLREGDYVVGKVARESSDEMYGLVSVASVNGRQPDSLSERPEFRSLTPVYPDRRLSVAVDGELAGRMIDLFSPLGVGQRALVSAPQGSPKTTILKDVARGVCANNPEVKVIILSIDCRPEEATDYRRSLKNAEVFTADVETGAADCARSARLALEYAKRQTELSKDVVLIIDDLTSLARVLNSEGKTASSTLETCALDGAKRFFCSAVNAEEGGSLTVVSALCNDSDDPVDSAVYSNMKDLCSMRITLSPELTRSRVYPPIDALKSWAYKEELLLTADELKAVAALRSSSVNFQSLFARTKNNAELCGQIIKEN